MRPLDEFGGCVKEQIKFGEDCFYSIGYSLVHALLLDEIVLRDFILRSYHQGDSQGY
jgi:hypothetical protein